MRRGLAFLAVSAMAVAVLVGGTPAHADTVETNCTNTTYVNGSNKTTKNTNYGSDVNWQLKSSTKFAFVECAVSGIPADATNISAALKVYSRSVNSSHTVRLHNQPTSWVENTVTWNVLHTFDSAVLDSQSAGSSVEVSLNASNVTGNGRWRFALDTISTSTQYYASDDYTTEITKRPKLVVTYTPPPTKQLLWGMFNVPTAPVPAGYCGAAATTVTVPVIEFNWESFEPTDDAWNTTYINQQIAKYDAYRPAGCTKISLNWGMHHPPTFIENAPNAKFVNQYGEIYSGDDAADLISNTTLRPEAEEYALKVFEVFGPTRPFHETRIGGTTWGELGYPPAARADGLDNYWSFNALATDNPVPAYRPCTGDPAQAGGFANWHIDRISTFLNWQINAVNAAKAFPTTHADPGNIAGLFPGNNMTEAEITTVINGNLCSNTVPENDGKFPRGHMFERQINSVPLGTNFTVWGTWANNPNTTNAILDDLADARGFDIAHENSGPGSIAKVQPTEDTCRAAFSDGPAGQDVTCYWIRYGDPGTAEFITAITTDP